MRSEKQIQASRANGARSKRPITTQGKRNSSRNNLRHGFAARDQSLDLNPPAAFTTLQFQYMANHQPGTAYEIQMVHTMAVARWRTSLVSEVEKRVLDKAMARQKANSADPLRQDLLAFEDAPECHALLRCQIAFDLQFKRALTRLTALENPKPASRTAKNAHAVRTQEQLESKRTAGEPDPTVRVHNPPVSRNRSARGPRIAKTRTQFEPKKPLNLKGPHQKPTPPLGFKHPLILGFLGSSPPPRGAVEFRATFLPGNGRGLH